MCVCVWGGGGGGGQSQIILLNATNLVLCLLADGRPLVHQISSIESHHRQFPTLHSGILPPSLQMSHDWMGHSIGYLHPYTLLEKGKVNPYAHFCLKQSFSCLIQLLLSIIRECVIIIRQPYLSNHSSYSYDFWINPLQILPTTIFSTC